MSKPLKDLLRTADLSRADIEKLLTTSRKFAEKPLRSKKALANQTVAIYMTKSSTRTRIASETAIAHLGGSPIFLRSDDLQIGRGETISDTAKVISGFCSALIVRTFAQSDVEELGKHATIPVINALTDDDHPTQLLADWVTIRERFGENLAGRKLAYIGDGNNVAAAWLIMGARMGAHIVVATPPGKWAPKQSVVNEAKKIAEGSGAIIEVITDPKAAATGASAIYTDVWISMGDSEADRTEKIAALSAYTVDKDLMKLSASDSIFMHCLPAHRGEEVTAEVIDGEKSVVWRQAFHRRTTIQALLYHLTKGDLVGNK
ncbi:MAG: ornithine carbamoyltransferase [Candidatus Nanopelagicus sp.]